MKLRAIIALLSASLLTLVFALASGAGPQIDTDGDGVFEDPSTTSDNCISSAFPNPAQRDDDQDGYGNSCDHDVNNDCVIGGPDLGDIFAAFGASIGNGWNGNPLLASHDVNEDNTVGGPDLGDTFALFGGAPGPTSRTCADCAATPFTGVCP
jgi:hypothetical protein